MIHAIEYTAPVLAFVDTEGEEVIAVRVDNHNEVYPTGNGFDEQWSTLTEEQRAEALRIAQTSRWPRWRLEQN